jgi:arylformamidase
MTIDYEKEYDHRGRVPEHPQILARMAEDAARYRARAAADRRAELDVPYGPNPRQIVDIFYPRRRANAPLAMFIHGGYWRALQPSAFSQVAAGLNERGFTVTLVGYDLCPHVTIGTIVDQVRHAAMTLWRRFQRPILVLGHSAGGHLAASTLATDWASLGAPADLVPAAMGISGLYDLAPMCATSMNADFKLNETEARRLSPLYGPVPRGRVFDAVVGGTESAEFQRQSRTIAEVWRQGGVATRYDAPASANHFNVIAPLADPTSAMVERLVSMARG